MSSISDLRAALTAAESAHAKIQTDAADALRVWQAKRADIGAEPPMGKEPLPPDEPTIARPDGVDEARALVTNAPFNRELCARYERKLAADQTASDVAALAMTAATTRAALVTATLAAARQAPSDIAREQAGEIETPRVRFVFPTERTKQTPHLTAEFNHPTHGWIPFSSASSGEQVEASVHVQARIRELAAKKAPAFAYVPIVADLGDYNGGTGPYPDVPGFVLWHVSDDAGTPLSVSAGCPS